MNEINQALQYELKPKKNASSQRKGIGEELNEMAEVINKISDSINEAIINMTGECAEYKEQKEPACHKDKIINIKEKMYEIERYSSALHEMLM